MRICAIIYMGLKIHATYDIFNLYIIISMFIMCATKYFIMTEKMDFYGIRDIMNETLNEKKAFVPRHGDKESLDNITAQLNEAKMHPCVFLNNHAIGIEAAGDFMKLLNSGEEQYADNDMVDKDLLKNVYNTLKKIYKDEGKKLKESTMFDSVLKESGIEVYPEDGKLKARNIGQQVVSSRTQNKLNPLGTRDVAKPLTPTQKAVTSTVLNILNDKGKAGDINSEFDTNPRPDITLMANGDAVITPDGQKSRSYKIPASEIDAHMKESDRKKDTLKNLHLREFASNQLVNYFMKKGVERYFNEYIICIDDDWYTPNEWIDEENLENDYGVEYIFEMVEQAVKKSLRYLKSLGVTLDDESDESYNMELMKEFLDKIAETDTKLFENHKLNEARAFPHSSGFGLSGHYDYEEPKDDSLYIATETNEDDGELYFDEKGNTTEFKTDAKKFTSKEDALEFAKNNVIFGEPGTKLFESKTEPTQRINQMKKDGKINKNAKPTIMKEYVSNQITNTFMRHGVEKYFHEYIIVVDDDWYTPCEFISENGLEDSFGPEYVFEQVVIAVKSSIRWLKNQGIQPDENDEDVSYNLWEMIDFVGSLKKSDALNESNVVIAQWRRDTAERLIKEANKIDPSYSFVEYDIGPKKEIKHKIYKNDNEYVGTFDVFTDEPYNSPYRFFFNHVNLPNVEFQGMDIDEFDKMFKDFITTDKRLGHKR